jgi:hypothetical protein
MFARRNSPAAKIACGKAGSNSQRPFSIAAKRGTTKIKMKSVEATPIDSRKVG